MSSRVSSREVSPSRQELLSRRERLLANPSGSPSSESVPRAVGSSKSDNIGGGRWRVKEIGEAGIESEEGVLRSRWGKLVGGRVVEGEEIGTTTSETERKKKSGPQWGLAIFPTLPRLVPTEPNTTPSVIKEQPVRKLSYIERKRGELSCYGLILGWSLSYVVRLLPTELSNFFRVIGWLWLTLCTLTILHTLYRYYHSLLPTTLLTPNSNPTSVTPQTTTTTQPPEDNEFFINLQQQQQPITGGGTNQPTPANFVTPLHHHPTFQGTAVPGISAPGLPVQPYSNIFNPPPVSPPTSSNSCQSGLLGHLTSIRGYLTMPFTPSSELPRTIPTHLQGLKSLTPTQTLHMLGDSSDGTRLALKTRIWFASKVLRPLSDRIQVVDRQLQKLQLSYLDSKSHQFNYRPTLTQPPTLTGEMKPRNLMELYQADPQNPHIIDRLKQERSINVRGYDSRDYILKRIHGLAQQGIAQYRWNSGFDPSWTFQTWYPSLPTDAELLCHLFVTFMDLNTATNLNATEFSRHHFATVDDHRTSGIFIKELATRPPHYVVVDNGTLYQLPEGADNLFLALYLFTYLIAHHHRGYLGSSHLLTASPLGLGQLILPD